jgi:hypothetical protein
MLFDLSKFNELMYQLPIFSKSKLTLMGSDPALLGMPEMLLGPLPALSVDYESPLITL